ncbi:AAA family ATPase [bacterium D16-51]|nr:AAA family ATPase [bacterium D16-59]RKI58343.1 AAA family ATPase [bacterium D16-51]
MEHRSPIPIGVEFYKKMVDNGYYYIDKTLLIRELLDQEINTVLFTRPRRFGKTLAQSMIKTFFEKEILSDGTVADNSIYFQGKKIMEAGEKYLQHMGKYPVIFLSLKSAKQPTYEMAYGSLVYEILKEYSRHSYVLESKCISEEYKKIYNSVLDRTADCSAFARAIAFLSECLEKYHKQKVIILFDEYDVPLENAYFEGFYSEMASFIRSLFESALKTNESLEFAVVTGCLQISRESIFTGLNNLKVVSVLDGSFAEYFGFTQQEVDAFLSEYGIMQRRDEVKNWYEGYLFGDTEIYNPWSLINYVFDIANGNTEFPRPYWSNTSSNSIVRELIENADDIAKQEIEELIAGGMIEKPVYEEITYAEIYKSQDYLWNFLFFTGYLKVVGKKFTERQIYFSMAIPNEEIAYIYENNIREWSVECIQQKDLSELIRAFEDGDCEKASDIITEQLIDTISFYEYKEDYYHGFFAGLLKHNGKYLVKSNRESGLGRYDLLLKTQKIRKGRAIIFEFKVAASINGLKEGCRDALEQIEKLHYDREVIAEGYTDILKYGICFYKKECMVQKI